MTLMEACLQEASLKCAEGARVGSAVTGTTILPMKTLLLPPIHRMQGRAWRMKSRSSLTRTASGWTSWTRQRVKSSWRSEHICALLWL